jgi:putative spermidine/putrescine transport system substrate-binding protein
MNSELRSAARILLTITIFVCGGGSIEDARAQTCSTLNVVSYGGGAYQQSHIDSFANPFSTFAGLSMRSLVWDANYGTLKSMVDSKVVDWDVVDVPTAQFARGRDEGIYERLTRRIDPQGFLPNTVTDFGVGNVYWATVLAYKRSSYSGAAPDSWADFFDLRRFPGPRGMYDDPRANLEFALLADGMLPKDVYPLTSEKIDRAFRKLDTIKGSIRAWWGDGSQPIQLLLNNVVVLSTAWSGRIFASKIANADLAYTWNGAALELDYWIIPKGSRCVDAASRFIAFASTAAAMADQASRIAYGPVNLGALSFLSPEIQAQLPTYPANFSKAFVVNAENWRSMEDSARARWTRWKNAN